ncbi:hypothetical protein DPV78_012114 [Talaromyces pinophilus]|nr:hypothetical protein DPV78_012114 [Talaromyces pinophilus]
MSSDSSVCMVDLTQRHGGNREPPSLSTSGSCSVTDQHPSTAGFKNSKQEISQDELDSKPWKYIGYHGYSAFLASDNDFCSFRRFDKLNLRVILALQDKITCLEEELEDIDRLYSRQDVPDENNGSFRYDTRQERVKCIWKIKDALEEYINLRFFADSFVLQYINIKARADTAEREVNSLKNWFYNHEGAIYAKEQSYIDKDDLFPLIPKERSPLRRLFETSSRFRLSHFWKREKLAGTISDLPVHCHENIQLYSDKKIDDFVTFTTVFTGLVMLIAPIWILAYTHPVAAKLAIITAFILFFLALVSFGTNSKPFESLAATAAYSAILMVFLQLGGNH